MPGLRQKWERMGQVEGAGTGKSREARWACVETALQ